MKIKLKKVLSILLCTMLIATITPSATAYADMGPKPSVNIEFIGLGDELCYATLLSKHDSTGPATVWDGNPEHAEHSGNYEYRDLDYETWKAFAEYEDTDGYYFLQEAWVVNESKSFAWTYYPPNPFKVLLYFPEQNVFATSGIYERYAFDSYFTIDVSDMEIVNGENLADPDTVPETPQLLPEIMTAEKSYNYDIEIVSLFARIVVTIAIELLIALLFRFRQKKQLVFIGCVNVMTQVALNLALNIVNYNLGALSFIIAFFLFEVIVFVIEAIAYSIFIGRVSIPQKKDIGFKALCIAYALVANLASYAAGFAISQLFPAMF